MGDVEREEVLGGGLHSSQGLPAWGLTLLTLPQLWASAVMVLGWCIARCTPETCRGPAGRVPGSFSGHASLFVGKLFSANRDWWSDKLSAPWSLLPSSK